MVTPCDAPTTATTIDSVTIDMTDASKTKTTDIVAQEADDDSNHVAVESSDDSNSAIMHGMLRKAVADPNQPSVDDWLVLPFSGEAVEEAYQANLAPGRAMGVVFAVVLSALWTLVFNTLGNAESSSSITDLYALVLLPIFLLSVAPFFCTMLPLQRWKPVKHRTLVYATCCIASGLFVVEHAAIVSPRATTSRVQTSLHLPSAS